MNVTDGMKHDWSNKFYKAIFAIRYKPRQTENIYTTKGMACAVNFGTTEKPSVAVVTWNGVLDADYNSGKPMTMHRFSKSHADYILNVPPQVRLSGRFSFLPVEDSESKKFMVESLDMKALSAEQQMSNHKAYCFCGTGKSADFLKMELKYDKGKKTHVVIAHKTTHDSSSFPGSPIIVDENSKKYVVGVLGQGETFFPCFLTKGELFINKLYQLLKMIYRPLPTRHSKSNVRKSNSIEPNQTKSNTDSCVSSISEPIELNRTNRTQSIRLCSIDFCNGTCN